jgi:type II secretory pathway predicted ATPase ExeA
MTTSRPAPASPPRKGSFYSDFDDAKAKLITAIHRGPFYGLLIGASGTGKTSLLRRVAAICDRHRYQVHYLSGTQTTSPGLRCYLVDALRLSQRRSHAETVRVLAQTLRESLTQLILFLDDADLLPEATLQETRLLAESELDAPQLFTVVFSGMPDLKTTLDDPSMFPLKRRISLRLELTGLKKDEVRPFIMARLDGAERLSEDVTAAIFERARGIPAMVESLAGLCLHAVPGKDPITLGSVEEVLESWEVT